MCFRETNPWSTNSFLHTIHLFVIRSDENCFDEYSFSVSLKSRLTGETAKKHLRWKIDSPKRQITFYTLFVFRLLFVVSSVFHRYSRIVYSGLYIFSLLFFVLFCFFFCFSVVSLLGQNFEKILLTQIQYK